MSIPQLPNEVWLEITGFLGHEAEYLHKVWTLKSLFLQRYLDARYHAVELFPNRMDPQRLLSWLEHLSEPHIKTRIGRLDIYTPKAAYYETMESEALLFPGVSGLTRGFNPDSENLANDVNSILDWIVVNLPHLHSVNVDSKGDTLPKPVSTLVRTLWKHQTQTLGPENMTICHLFLDVPASDLGDMFLVTSQSTSICMTQLKTLSMSIRSIDTEGCNTVGAFFRALANPPTDSTTRPHLSSLSLHFHCEEVHQLILGEIFRILCPTTLVSAYTRILKTGHIDAPGALSKTIPLFPQLTHFSLFVIGPIRGYIVPALEFLAAQGSTLTHIRLPPHRLTYRLDIADLNPGQLDWSWQLAPSLPKIEYFEMVGLEQYSLVGLRAICAYLARSNPENINTLILDDPRYPLSYRELNDFFCHFRNDLATDPNRLAYAAALLRIGRISLHLLTLTANHFSLLSAGLPNLKVLEMRIFAVGVGGKGTGQLPLRGGFPIGSIPQDPYLTRGAPEGPIINSLNIAYFADGIVHQKAFFKDLRVFGSQGQFKNWHQESRFEEMRVCLKDMDGKSVNDLRDALKETFPGVRQIVVGNGIDLTSSIFDPVDSPHAKPDTH